MRSIDLANVQSTPKYPSTLEAYQQLSPKDADWLLRDIFHKDRHKISATFKVWLSELVVKLAAKQPLAEIDWEPIELAIAQLIKTGAYTQLTNEATQVIAKDYGLSLRIVANAIAHHGPGPCHMIVPPHTNTTKGNWTQFIHPKALLDKIKEYEANEEYPYQTNEERDTLHAALVEVAKNVIRLKASEHQQNR